MDLVFSVGRMVESMMASGKVAKCTAQQLGPSKARRQTACGRRESGCSRALCASKELPMKWKLGYHSAIGESPTVVVLSFLTVWVAEFRMHDCMIRTWWCFVSRSLALHVFRTSVVLHQCSETPY